MGMVGGCAEMYSQRSVSSLQEFLRDVLLFNDDVTKCGIDYSRG